MISRSPEPAIIDQIKSLIKSGDIAGAAALCKQALEADPANAELKMRYGLCRQLLGDEETFKRIHDELAPEMEKKPTSLWRKYHKLWLSLIVGALVIGGTAGWLVFGKQIKKQFKTMVYALYAAPKNPEFEMRKTDCLYAGPRYYERERGSE